MENLHGARIVLVEDDEAQAEYVRYVLQEMAGCVVDHHVDPERALEALTLSPCDAVITDMMLPGMDGLEFMRRLQPARPAVPVIAVTAFATVDMAVEAVQARAAGFLRKPFSPDDLMTAVGAQIAESRRRRPNNRVLAIGAHPDDIELGVGATLFRHRSAQDDITMLVLTQGMEGGDSGVRATEAEAAARKLGATLIFGDLEDTRISEGHPTVSVIEDAIAQARPTLVYVHSDNDVHQDHRNAHRATLVAARRVPAIYCYQSPSATVGFSPTLFVGVDTHVNQKLDLIATHDSQASTRPYMEPALIDATARYWGRFADSRYAEPFEVVRERAVRAGGAGNVAA